jgi:hypothetical protein
LLVIPAQAGIQWRPRSLKPCGDWIPACAGMTGKGGNGGDLLNATVRLPSRDA